MEEQEKKRKSVLLGDHYQNASTTMRRMYLSDLSIFGRRYVGRYHAQHSIDASTRVEKSKGMSQCVFKDTSPLVWIGLQTGKSYGPRAAAAWMYWQRN